MKTAVGSLVGQDSGSRLLPLVIGASDSVAVGDALRMFLKQDVETIEIYRTARDLLRRLQQTRPDLVVTDMELSDSDGIALMREIHARDETIPVVVLGRPGDVASGVLAMRSGALDYFEKPFFQTALRRRVEQFRTGRKDESTRAGPGLTE